MIKMNNFEIRNCTFVIEDQRIEGVFIHELSDEFGNGDGVIADLREDHFESDQDAEDALTNEYLDTNGTTLDTIIFE